MTLDTLELLIDLLNNVSVPASAENFEEIAKRVVHAKRELADARAAALALNGPTPTRT